MKRFRRLSAFVMVLTLLVSLSISVWAADYDAASAEDLTAAFSDTSGEDVNINVTADIDAGYTTYFGQDGITYNINSENGSSVSNAVVNGGTIVVDTTLAGETAVCGTAGMIVNGNVDGNIASWADSSVNIAGSVNGDVTSWGNTTVNIAGDVDGSVSVSDSAQLTISGDVNSESFGIDAQGGTVTVGGNVTAGTVVFGNENGELYAYGGTAVSAAGGSSVTVGGDAIGGSVSPSENNYVSSFGGYAVIVSDSSSVTIGGDAVCGTAPGNANGIGVVAHGSDDGTSAYTSRTISGTEATEPATAVIGGDVIGGVSATGNAEIDITGSVYGNSGNPDDVDMSDPYGFSDGATAIVAMDNATVNVGGDVTGGDAYGTYGWAGSGIQTMGEATVSVAGNVTGGNVTADPETVADETNSMGGTAVQTSNSATVTIGGDVTGGSTNGSNGIAGNGIVIFCEESESETGSVAVAGAVSSGEGEHEGAGIVVDKFTEDAEIPEISAGSCDSISGNGLTDEEFEQLVSDIEATYTKTYTMWDHLNGILWLIQNAKAGDEITVDMCNYPVLATSIIEAVKEADVKLIIKWNGGDDLVIDKTFSAEIEGNTIEMAKLAELLKK